MPHGPDDRETSGAETRNPAPVGFEGGLLSLLPSLRRYARSLTRDATEGEDLLQDVVERALLNRRQWSGTNLRGWTFTIMTNLFRNRLRRNAVTRQTVLEKADTLTDDREPADPLRRDRLLAALNTLPPDQRTTLMLVVVEGYSYAETAEITGAPIGTVMSRLARARSSLAGMLENDNVIALRRPE